MKHRRSFLTAAGTALAGVALPCDADAESQATQASTLRPASTTQPAGAMPTFKLGKFTVSKLMIGGNPFHGYSHFNSLYSKHMLEWADRDRVCGILANCEKQGINTWQFSHHERGVGDLLKYREKGGNIQFILLSHREIEEDHRLIKEVAKLKPVAIVHHGGSSERKRRAGKTGEIRDFLKAIRDNGILAGLSTHDPDFLREAEEQNWETDLYMTALYYLTRSPEEFRKILGTRPLGEIYLPEDPPKMLAAMRQAKKTCLAYKVLAAGRLTDRPADVEAAFRNALQGMKPNDGMIIGMYPRYQDQVADNAALVRKICASLPAGA
ncbi:MAG: hypothetical protein JNL98_10155 [Bryobacterales bacterium]|nr:hypothetical protein [Bryobacterales bacterium]